MAISDLLGLKWIFIGATKLFLVQLTFAYTIASAKVSITSLTESHPLVKKVQGELPHVQLGYRLLENATHARTSGKSNLRSLSANSDFLEVELCGYNVENLKKKTGIHGYKAGVIVNECIPCVNSAHWMVNGCKYTLSGDGNKLEYEFRTYTYSDCSDSVPYSRNSKLLEMNECYDYNHDGYGHTFIHHENMDMEMKTSREGLAIVHFAWWDDDCTEPTSYEWVGLYEECCLDRTKFHSCKDDHLSATFYSSMECSGSSIYYTYDLNYCYYHGYDDDYYNVDDYFNVGLDDDVTKGTTKETFRNSAMKCGNLFKTAWTGDEGGQDLNNKIDNKSSNSIPIASIVGILIGCIAICGVAALLAFFYVKSRHSNPNGEGGSQKQSYVSFNNNNVMQDVNNRDLSSDQAQIDTERNEFPIVMHENPMLDSRDSRKS